MAESPTVNRVVEGSSPSSTASWNIKTGLAGVSSYPLVYVRDCPYCNYELDIEQFWFDGPIECVLELCRYCEREFIAVFIKTACTICEHRIDCLCWKMVYIEETK